MRGDSLTPLGNIKDPESLLGIFTSLAKTKGSLNSASYFGNLEEKVMKAFNTGKPFLKGQWVAERANKHLYFAPLITVSDFKIAMSVYLDVLRTSSHVKFVMSNDDGDYTRPYYVIDVSDPLGTSSKYDSQVLEARELLYEVTGVDIRGSY